MIPLRSSQDFELLKTKGRRASPAPWLVLQWKANSNGRVRLGCTLPRYVGGAVVRNRLRRWTKEYVRKWSNQVEKDQTIDINIFFRRQAADFYSDLNHQEFDVFLGRGFERIKTSAG